MTLRLLSILSFASAIAAETYTIQPAPGSELRLFITKTGPVMGGKKHDLLFEKYSGKLDYDAAAPERSKVEFTIDANSLVVKDDWVKQSQLKDIRDEALGRNGIDAARHSEMRFVSTSIEKLSGGGYLARGSLTVRGIAKPASISLSVTADGARLTLAGKSKVKLTDYGIKPPKAALGLIGTQDEMDFTFRVVAAK
jgi:polyisoprenoid-binding protein YceI